jgi:hypothetical protein
MKINDVKTLWAVRRHAADEAAQQLARADAQRTDAERAVATFRAHVGDEVQRAQGLGLSETLALWYDTAGRRLHDLRAAAATSADGVAAARELLRIAMTEAERVGTVSEQLQARRRVQASRRAQGEMDEQAQGVRSRRTR